MTGETKYTNGDAVDIIENEGLSYAVLHYCSGHDFKDDHTMLLWNRAELALIELTAYLESETGREID